MSVFRSVVDRFRFALLGRRDAEVTTPGLEALERARVKAQEARVRVKILHVLEMARKERLRRDDVHGVHFFVGFVTVLSIVLVYMVVHQIDWLDWQIVPTGEKILVVVVLLLMLAIGWVFTVVPIVIVVTVVGVVSFPILLFFSEAVVALWFHIREKIHPIGHHIGRHNLEELEYFASHASWPTSEELEQFRKEKRVEEEQ